MARSIDMTNTLALAARMGMTVDKFGDLVTPPVFLNFTRNLFIPTPPKAEDVAKAVARGRNPPEPKFGVNCLFLKNADFTLLRSIEDAIYTEKGCKRLMIAGKPKDHWIGQQDYLYSQEDKGLDAKTGELRIGHTYGAKMLRLTSRRKPLVTKKDKITGDHLIIDKPSFDLVYDGVLAVLKINAYYSGEKAAKQEKETQIQKGVAWGIVSATIINSNTPKWFEGGGRKVTVADLADINISEDDIIDFEDPDGNVEHESFLREEEEILE